MLNVFTSLLSLFGTGRNLRSVEDSIETNAHTLQMSSESLNYFETDASNAVKQYKNMLKSTDSSCAGVGCLPDETDFKQENGKGFLFKMDDKVFGCCEAQLKDFSSWMCKHRPIVISKCRNTADFDNCRDIFCEDLERCINKTRVYIWDSTFDPDNNVCIQSAINSMNDISGHACNGNGNTTYQGCICKEGYGTPKCEKCPTGTLSINEKEPCLNIDSCGTHPCNAGNADCTDLLTPEHGFTCTCPKGRFGGNISYKHDAESKLICKSCPAGYYQDEPGNDDCVKCAVGKYSTTVGATKESTCDNCPAGSYQDAKGKTECKQCPKGTWSSTIGASNFLTCLNCSAGLYSTTIGATEESTCENCLIGYYQAEPGKTECKECTAGYYQAEPGKKECVKCSKGTYSSANGATKISTCEDCGEGWYDHDSDSSTQCKSCPKGYHQSSTKATECTICPVGKYIDDVGASFCKLCDVTGIVCSVGGTRNSTSCSVEDECGVCGGSGIPEGDCDCDRNVEDECGVCGGSGIPEGDCDCSENVDDCNGDCGGTAVEDDCGVCGGSGIPEGDCDCSGKVEDDCGVCGGSGIPEGYCDCYGMKADCYGECGGSAVEDDCGVCAGPGILEGYCDCSENVEDCNGDCGGSAVEDDCGVCGGDGSSCAASSCVYEDVGSECLQNHGWGASETCENSVKYCGTSWTGDAADVLAATSSTARAQILNLLNERAAEWKPEMWDCCQQTCCQSGHTPQCEDDTTFKDALGYRCLEWSGYSCDDDNNYEDVDLATVRAACPVSCSTTDASRSICCNNDDHCAGTMHCSLDNVCHE